MIVSALESMWQLEDLHIGNNISEGDIRFSDSIHRPGY
jgi:hypothetical protein